MSTFHLAVELDGAGAHPAAWRRASRAPAALLAPERVRAVVQVAENAGFTLATFDDSLLPPGGVGPVARIGAVERSAFAAVHTSVLGLVPVLSTTYHEPFHVSSQLASLDFAATGRAGWLVGTTADPAAARAWGRPLVEGAEALRREARDAVWVARDLWDSWEDDAAIRDVDTGRYLDRDKIHYIDFVGETYSVKGPAIVPRPPQGQVVVLAPAGLLPARLADVELVEGRPEPVTAPRPGLRFVELEVLLDTPARSAAERLAELDAHLRWEPGARLRYAGPPAGLVTLLTELAGVADGVRIHPAVLDEDLPELSARVLPGLFRGRIATRPVPGSSLRSTLGLGRPANRFLKTVR
ncbi:LLM class flavin-dependent oxidoreductase [Pseudonocardia oroxyli]|uniref:Luciferase-like monooxygenase n=1 Tax=Pseudonocardia oroxyli TaxID=366584 RepID=A0A1G8CDH6_PSEOR|nr:LLM class flavin-dependent oxidoreductase [Pseudonocardia oroxyli]SDH43233.1 Luciferase-like monooxygenase [Pseudonocardia oroxyli]